MSVTESEVEIEVTNDHKFESGAKPAYEKRIGYIVRAWALDASATDLSEASWHGAAVVIREQFTSFVRAPVLRKARRQQEQYGAQPSSARPPTEVV